MPEFVGQAHTNLLQWLSQTWLLEKGKPICFLQGFPGVGKSSLARKVMEATEQHSGWSSVMVDMPESSGDPVDDLLMHLSTELSWARRDKLADAVREGKSLENALKAVLKQNVLIIIDEFQRALDPETGQPLEELEEIFQQIARRPTIPGRMLLLTNRLIAQEVWSEPYERQELVGFALSEAEQFLTDLLQKTNPDKTISPEQCREAVKCLGRNPRAIEILVDNLRREPLEDLIGQNPEDWELRDREFSASLVSNLEKRLLEKTLSHLPAVTQSFLKQISVHRKPPKRKAMELLVRTDADKKGKKTFNQRIEELSSRFLIKQDKGWYSLHPVAREIALQRLKSSADELEMAHSKAADFYVQPFTTGQEASKLGGFFVEARYHLVQAGRDQELGEIAQKFETYWRGKISRNSIPKPSEELDETIAVFLGLVESAYSEEFEEYLARLFQVRNQDGDLSKAWEHAKRATEYGYHVSSWTLRVDLEIALYDGETALETCHKGIEQVSSGKEIQQLYNRSVELLTQLGRTVSTPWPYCAVGLRRCARSGELRIYIDRELTYWLRVAIEPRRLIG
jgi:AcrR family transcriptional regulator